MFRPLREAGTRSGCDGEDADEDGGLSLRRVRRLVGEGTASAMLASATEACACACDCCRELLFTPREGCRRVGDEVLVSRDELLLLRRALLLGVGAALIAVNAARLCSRRGNRRENENPRLGKPASSLPFVGGSVVGTPVVRAAAPADCVLGRNGLLSSATSSVFISNLQDATEPGRRDSQATQRKGKTKRQQVRTDTLGTCCVQPATV